VRREVRRIMAEAEDYADGGDGIEAVALIAQARGMADAMQYFAPAEGRRLAAEIREADSGRRDPRTWRPIKAQA
jgi:hypothetical protein